MPASHSPVERFRDYGTDARAELELLEELEGELDFEELLDDDERELEKLDLDELELDDEDDDGLEDELDGELELDEGSGPDELDESVGPLTLPSVQPPSTPTPASANPPERSLRNSLRSSRRCCSSRTREGALSIMDTSARR